MFSAWKLKTWLPTLVMRKTEVIVRAEGIVPNASERVSTSPPAMLVDVPG